METAWASTEESWAETEFAGAEWGDARRTPRVITLATALAPPPDAGLPEACGSRADLKAAYRVFAHEASESAELWASQVAATLERAVRVPVV
jgi:Transposase DNA-binding